MQANQNPKYNEILPTIEGTMHNVVSTKVDVVIVCIFILLILIGVWGVKGRLNEYVTGVGILGSGEGYHLVISNGNGYIDFLDIKEGDTVHAGQLVGRIYDYNGLDELYKINIKLKLLEEKFCKTASLIEDLKTSKQKGFNKQVTFFTEILERLKKQSNWYSEYLSKLDTLTKRGSIPANSLIEARMKYDEILDKELDVKKQNIISEINLKSELYDYTEELEKARLEIDNVVLEAETLSEFVKNSSRIISDSDGIVTNINYGLGDYVKLGDVIAKLAPINKNSDYLEMNAYCSYLKVKDVGIGMKVRIVPTNIKYQRDGAIIGTIIGMSELPDTPTELERHFKNEFVCNKILKECDNLPVKVNILVSKNEDNYSGYNWTTGKGPEIKIKDNSICNVMITVKNVSPISLIFENMQKYLIGNNSENIKINKE